MRPRLVSLAALGVALVAVTANAQPLPARDTIAPAVAAAAASAERSASPAALRYANREILVFRASVLSRPPADRASAAVQFLDRLIAESPAARVSTMNIGDAAVLLVGDRPVFIVVPDDVNTLAGETVQETAARAGTRLQRAFDEAVELRSPRRLFRPVLVGLAATAIFITVFWVLYRLYRRLGARLPGGTERKLTRLTGSAEVVRAVHLPQVVKYGFDLAALLLLLFLSYLWFTFVFRLFPYTRPWGESLRGTLIDALQSIALLVIHSLPNLFTLLAILLVTRFAVRLIGSIFSAIERGQISVPWMYPETAQPTRRIVSSLLWLLALVVAYPYMPGSGTDAFKGVSVFAGLMISLGSSGIMNQVMSGLTITYSRAVRVGDFVKVGDTEGTVQHLGVLSMKITTPKREEITIPNALVVSTSTTNYSRYADSDGVQVPTSITIGYDTPWRQVHALLLLAAGRTDGLRASPPPVVRQTGLRDFYVEYTLLVCVANPQLRAATLTALHANILDAFNEFGVQITSPNYESDPAGAKVVPPERWFAAPAVPSREVV